MGLKKTIYIVLTMVFGLFLSFIVHAIMEIFYIKYFLSKGIVLNSSTLTSRCYLPSFLQIFLILAGLVGGYFLGRKWWYIVYINKRQ